MHKFKLDDDVIIVYNYSGRKEQYQEYKGVVTKVGRKWATVTVDAKSWPQDWQIAIDGGHGKPDPHMGWSHHHGYTPEGLADAKRYDDLVDEFRKHCNTGFGGFRGEISTNQLERIIDILEEDHDH